MIRNRPAATAASLLLIVAAGGCPPPQRQNPLAPIPMQDAWKIVSANADRITGTLRAAGTLDGYFQDANGRRRRYQVDATLFYLEPHYLRFDLKKFNDRQLLFGSNATDYWFYTKENGAYYCGRHGFPEDLPPDVPAHPQQIGDALGLSIPSVAATRNGDRIQVVQRIVDNHQQVLFLEHDETGRLLIEKEYWLDRLPPRLVRRVVFRDANGVVEMQSQLGGHTALHQAGPLLPTVMIANWPKSQAQMRFRINKWSEVGQVSPESIQFATPKECAEKLPAPAP